MWFVNSAFCSALALYTLATNVASSLPYNQQDYILHCLSCFEIFNQLLTFTHCRTLSLLLLALTYSTILDKHTQPFE